MKEVKRIEVELPFMGFYESIHDRLIDDAIESHFSYDYDNDTDKDISEVESDAIYSADTDWQAIRVEYCQVFTNKLNNKLNLELEYSDMTSPQFYNFSTDRLFVTIPESILNKVRKEVESYSEFEQSIKDRFTSYDGFMSFYSNDIKDDEWTRKELDQCQYEVYFDLYFKHNLSEDWEWNIASDIYCNEFESVDTAISVIEQYIKDNVKTV